MHLADMVFLEYIKYIYIVCKLTAILKQHNNLANKIGFTIIMSENYNSIKYYITANTSWRKTRKSIQ